MKKCCVFFSLASLLVVPSLHATLTATLTEVGGNANGGGLFQAVTSGNGTFDTFCLSIVTTFSPGTQYTYQVSPTIAANNIPPVESYITYGTAYIYHQFLAGNTAYGAGPVGDGFTIDNVQAAIWYLQGDLGGTDKFIDPENGADLQTGADVILNQLVTDTGKSLTALGADGNNAFDVQSLNLGAPGGKNQPQLVAAPEPATVLAGLLLLLPFGASTLRILRRNRAV